VVLDEGPTEQLRRLVLQTKRLRRDAVRWEREGRPETAQELLLLVSLLTNTIERIEQSLLRGGRAGVPTIFDPNE
jgi:hypothetical protein